MKRLCLHTVTTKPWDIDTALTKYAEAGIGGVSIWRDAVAGRDLREGRRQIQELGLAGVSLVRGGHFPHHDPSRRKAALEENRRCIEEARELGAAPAQTLETSRKQITDALSALADEAAAAGVTLGIEPLHPMYAGDRSAVNTLAQANDMAEDLVFDREIMGRGCIPLATITEWVEETGYSGFVEVEIFSTRYWQEDQSVFLSQIIEGYQSI